MIWQSPRLLGRLARGAVFSAERMNDQRSERRYTLIGWKEEEKLSRIVDHAELMKNDYNILPGRYIHTSDAETDL